MAAEGIKSAEALDELEDHLREEVARQGRAGLLSEEAFEMAVQNLGPPNVLSEEFPNPADLNETRERKWKLAWIGICALGYAAPLGLNAPHLFSQLSPPERWLAVTAFALTILSLFSGLVIFRFLPVVPDRKKRTKLQMAAFVPVFLWVCAFTFVLLPQVEFTFGALLVTTLWALSPIAFVGGVVFGLDEAAERRICSAGS